MLKPSKDSLFAVLSRSPWWLSLVIAAALFGVTGLLLPQMAAFAAGAPFLVIAAYAAWRQMKTPSPRRVAEVLERLRALPWEQFSTLIAEAYRRQGYEVVALDGGAADYELRKDASVSVVGCRRWKVAQTGVAPLRELVKVRQTRGARQCVYVVAGKLSANAQVFARHNGIELLSGEDLAKLLGRLLDHLSSSG